MVVSQNSLLWIGLFACFLSMSSVHSEDLALPDGNPHLACQLVKHENGLLLDVRTWWEFSLHRLPAAKNIWVGELPKRLDEVSQALEGDKTRPIVVYCTKGVRAAEAKKILQQAGFTRVTNLGGISDWEDCD